MAQRASVLHVGFGRLTTMLMGASLFAVGCGGRSPADSRAEVLVETGGATSLVPGEGGEPWSPAPAPSEPLLEAPDEEGAPAVEDIALRLTGDAFTIASEQRGLRGQVYAALSPRGTTLELVEVSGRICVRGQLARVPQGDYANYWGAEVGLILVASGTEPGSHPEALRTSGFAFELEGLLPPDLRLRVGAAGEVPALSQFCRHVPLETETRIEVPLSELTRECWIPGNAAFPAGSAATLVSWQIPANEWFASEFDFCVSAIEALP